jgi:xanthine dehydrogenase YagS FAD-binding subunit
LVNVKDIKELDRITINKKGELRLGALVNIQELVDSSLIRRSYPAIAHTAFEIASPQIRSVGTVGGNLCQRPRCWYYRAGFGLFGTDEAGKSLVLEGDNRYHAILGNAGPAYYVHTSSLAPLMIALGARLRIFGPNGGRDLPVESFYRIPRSQNEREYALAANEIITEVIVPAPGRTRSATYEVRQKEAFDWPLATASVMLELVGNKVQSARIVMGHVAPVPWRSAEAEQALIGKTINEEVAQAAGSAAVTGARSLGRNGYKIQLARVAVKRAILKAAQGGRR